ncbi:hypothetical protein KGZ01_11850 [Pseudomonas aeruginosa]|uniref:hypothetical protein n=1 Tax=Pseudomonas aeruginosa TaxID=287 RepID=UPI000F538322|nr:hypothetical protein [Pseudomonas aeruginosa]MDC3991919.1 hypothetical protein [Pseudomonas aeruginosa]RQE90785.1 hypothetical protein IPC292_03320 [Pseudomonas aeruginosa]HBP6729746.1 hypothetical protein [Pseudomonas aeruginosa]
MAKIIASEGVGTAWLAAARHLNTKKGRIERNMVLEISKPQTLSADDRTIIRAVDGQLRQHHDDLTIETVSGTIFPNGLYRREGRPQFYTTFLDLMEVGKKRNSWGTYALRMIQRKDPKGKGTFNPLDSIVERLLLTHQGTTYQAAYELGVHDIHEDFDPALEGYGFELPIYDPSRDAKPKKIPCLSHLSFKLTAGKLDLTAVYRSHWYCMRAQGNLVGLSQLHKFVGQEANYECGTLTCIATHAYLDSESFGGVKATSDFLQSLPAT